jgi:hypothetical protein
MLVYLFIVCFILFRKVAEKDLQFIFSVNLAITLNFSIIFPRLAEIQLPTFGQEHLQ